MRRVIPVGIALLLTGFTFGWALARQNAGPAATAAERAPPAATTTAPAPRPVDSAARHDAVDSLTQLLALEVEERQRLQRELAALQARVGELERGRLPGEAEAEPAASADATAARDADVATLEAFIEAGFAANEAAYLKRLYDEAQMARLYLRDQAVREGWHRSERYYEAVGALASPLEQVRAQMDDLAVDRFLYATGRPNRLAVVSVIGSSAAEQAGLRAGDVLYRYDGQRIYDQRQLVGATRDGRSGEAVPMEILRDGQRVTVYMPRGPLGVSMSSISTKP